MGHIFEERLQASGRDVPARDPIVAMSGAIVRSDVRNALDESRASHAAVARARRLYGPRAHRGASRRLALKDPFGAARMLIRAFQREKAAFFIGKMCDFPIADYPEDIACSASGISALTGD